MSIICTHQPWERASENTEKSCLLGKTNSRKYSKKVFESMENSMAPTMEPEAKSKTVLNIFNNTSPLKLTIPGQDVNAKKSLLPIKIQKQYKSVSRM